MDTVSSGWHHGYNASASTTDLSGGFDSGGSYLRKSPDQYSSRGSMESLDPPQSSQLHSGAQHSLGHHTHSGPHPAYSSCHQLSSARSSNSIDHLHSKRDSAYSSFSTSSSIPEYLASNPSFSPERSYSLETVPQREAGSGEIQQTDMCYIRTVYDTNQGLSQEHKLSSTSAVMLRNNDARGMGGARPGPSRDLQGSVGGVCYRGSNSSSSSSSGSSSGGIPASNRHSVGPIWGPSAGRSSYESLKGVPAPPRRSDSYAVIRKHERPNSWSSVDHARSLRSLQKGSCHHSSGPVASSAAKGSYSAEGQLHTVIEKSPESSPTTKPRQGGGFSQPPSPTGPSSGPAAPTPQSGHVILPTGVYPVPQLEPHYAQMPSTSHGPGSSGVYPALAKESGQQLQGAGGREEGVTERRRDGRVPVTENGYQNISPSIYPELHRPHMKTAGQGSDEQTGAQRSLNHQGPHGQTFQGSYSHTSQRPQGQVFQDQNQNQNQDFHISHNQSTAGLRPPSSQERRDHCIPVQSKGDRSRSMDQSSVHSEPVTSPRLAQGQVPHSQLPVHPQPQPPYASSQPPPRHLSESAALQYQDWDKDREHPLTRLENALAEVQHGVSPNSVVSACNHDSGSLGDSSQGPVRSLSVLEKVCRFERRERTGKQRYHGSLKAPDRATHTERCHSTPCGADDLRNMLERSTSRSKAHRTLSYKAGSSEQKKVRTPADPSLALQRSRSTFHLNDSREGDSRKDFPQTQDIQEMLGCMQDTSINRSYRDSLKDAQSKVLRSTSFRRRDLSSSVSPLTSATPPPFSTSSHQNPPVLAKQHSLEKKGPKTMPKPQGIIIPTQLQAPLTSLHTPKERHVVSPETRGPSPPALPSVPPVGPPALIRICGRKRLTVDQKKRSFSEPENMNEVGVSDPETAALFRRGGVADRRKMFEFVASRVGGGPLQNATSRPDLRQLQHNALADYVERKRSLKKDKAEERGEPRPHSAYLQPENSSHTASSCHSDTLSLSSTSSLLSLQDSGADRSFSFRERRLYSTLPPGADLRSLQSNLFYPGRVTTPRAPVQPLPGASSGSHAEPKSQVHQDITREAGLSRQSRSSYRDLVLDPQQLDAEPQLQQLNVALKRSGSTRGTGRSASAEDLLDISQERHMTPHHSRSRSSPIAETLKQDFTQGDVRMFGVFVSEPGRYSLADRPAEVQLSGGLVCVTPVQPAGPSHSSSHTPVTRRERQRNVERQRSSTSTLAASVGLPCPLSPAGSQDEGSAEWHASERLSQANLDAITFPSTSHGGDATCQNQTVVTVRQTRHSLSDGSRFEDTAKDMYRGRASSLETTAGGSALPPYSQCPNQTDSGNIMSSPPPSAHPSISQPLTPLHISESSHYGSTDRQHPLDSCRGLSQEQYDEVFLQNPPSPPPPIKETSILEEFLPLPPPPPLSSPSPPPLELEQEAQHHIVGSPTVEFSNNSIIPTRKLSTPTSPPSSVAPSPPILPPSMKPQLSSSTSFITPPPPPEDSLSLHYQPLPEREKTSQEQRVETLARQLVLQDGSLAPLLDTWGGKSTLDLMQEIFQNSRGVGKSPWQRRGSSRLDERIPDGVCDPGLSAAMDLGKETDLDEQDKDLNTRKEELCEALRSSVSALQQEKEVLCEEQRRHQALGASVDALVQEHLKTNERDKYSMFIGDLERIVNLLLSLCSRLSRMDRSLLALETEERTQQDRADERDSLLHKRSVLLGQTEDARELKENLDRRQRVVHAILSGYLTQPQLQDYRHFVSTKPSLLIRQRHVDDLIRQREEQLMRLAESLPPELAKADGWLTGSPLPSTSPAYSPSLFPPSVIPGSTHLVRPTTVTSL